MSPRTSPVSLANSTGVGCAMICGVVWYVFNTSRGLPLTYDPDFCQKATLQTPVPELRVERVV